MNRFFLGGIIIISMLFSSCTIQKRQHSAGFYINFYNLHAFHHKVKQPSLELNISAKDKINSDSLALEEHHPNQPTAFTADIKNRDLSRVLTHSKKTLQYSNPIQLSLAPTNQVEEHEPDVEEQLKKNKHRLVASIVGMAVSIVLVLASGLAYGGFILLQFFTIGIIGILIFGILILTFSGNKNKIKDKKMLDENRASTPIQDPTDLDLEIAKKRVRRSIFKFFLSLIFGIASFIGLVLTALNGSDLALTLMGISTLLGVGLIIISLSFMIGRIIRKNELEEKIENKRLSELPGANQYNTEEIRQANLHNIEARISKTRKSFFIILGISLLGISILDGLALPALILPILFGIFGTLITLIKLLVLVSKKNKLIRIQSKAASPGNVESPQSKITNLAQAEAALKRSIRSSLLFIMLFIFSLEIATLEIAPVFISFIGILGFIGALTSIVLFIDRLKTRNKLRNSAAVK